MREAMRLSERTARTGLFRLWVVAALAWIGYLAWRSDLSCPLELIGVGTGAGPWCEFQNAEPWKYYSALIIEMIGVPILVGIAIIAGLWVTAGFKPRA